MSNKSFNLILLVVILAAVGVGIYFLNNANMVAIAPATVATGGYQAIFLINNQVYFGKIAHESDEYLTLRDIYYLQVNQVLQPATGSSTAQQTVNDISLVKLGGELHGPTDEMRINPSQILLVENLRADSNVVKAIDAYKKDQAAKAATSTKP